MTTTLTEQARKESGLGLAWLTGVNVASPNGSPNAAGDPLADTVGFDCAGYVWGAYAVRCPTGTACTFRLHFRWDGQAEADDEWDEVQASDVTVADGRRATTRIRCAGAKRVYIEILTITGAGPVRVLWGNASGVAP